MTNEEFLKQYWSPNHSIHIGNLERALVEMRQQMDYVKETNGHIGRERNDLQQQLAASEAARKELVEWLRALDSLSLEQLQNLLTNLRQK